MYLKLELVCESWYGKGKGKVVPVHTMNMYGILATLNLNLGTRWN